MDENIMENDIFTLTDEDGNEIEFELIAQCERHGNKYFAMIPADDEEKDDDDLLGIKQLKESLGHKPIEVLAGALLGILVPLVMPL